MAKEISTYTHDGMELPFEDWSNKLHSFGDLTSIIQTTHDAALSSAVNKPYADNAQLAHRILYRGI